MKITIESTTRLVEVQLRGVVRPGNPTVPARVWEGQTESGIPVQVLVTRLVPIIPTDDPRQEEFARELQEQKAPTQPQAFDFRFFID